MIETTTTNRVVGRKQRPGDVQEDLPGARSIQSGGFVKFIGNVLQPGQEDHRIVTGSAPDGHNDHGDQGVLRASQPGGQV